MRTMRTRTFLGSDAAKEASGYYNGLPIEERRQLAPLLDHYRQMGLAEALGHLDKAKARITTRIESIRDA